MWPIFLSVLVLTPTLALGENHAGNKFSTDMFSLEIPKGMEIDESDANHISLIFEKDPDYALGTISVSAKNHKEGIDQDKAWEKIRSLTTNGRKLLSEGEVQLGGRKWKSISIMDETGSCQIRSDAFYAFSKTTTLIIHYHCEPSNCGKMTDAINQIASSFKIKSKRYTISQSYFN